MSNNPSRMVCPSPWFGPRTDHKIIEGHFLANTLTHPSNCLNSQIKYLHYFQKEKNLPICSTGHPTASFKKDSRRRGVENSSIALLTRKIKKDLKISLKKKIGTMTTSFSTLTLSESSEGGRERPERDLNQVI